MGAATKERIRVRDFYIGSRAARDEIVAVEYGHREHWNRNGTNPDGSTRRAYEVIVDGVAVGWVEHVTESTDRHYGRIRVPGKGRKAWGWGRYVKGKPPERHSPGCYERTRPSAVARILGYGYGEKVK